MTTLRITTTGPLPSDARVHLDGIDLTHDLMSLKLAIVRDDVTTATITIKPGHVEVDGDVLTALEAHIAHVPSE